MVEFIQNKVTAKTQHGHLTVSVAQFCLLTSKNCIKNSTYSDYVN